MPQERAGARVRSGAERVGSVRLSRVTRAGRGVLALAFRHRDGVIARTEDQLLSAVCGGDVRKVRKILDGEKSPRDLLRADADGWTVIHEASYYGQAECLKLLLTACATRNVRMVHLLLRHGADVNQRCFDGWTALHGSVSQEALEICELLVEHGAKIFSRNIYGVTPLFLAAQCGHLELLHFLIHSGADVNTEAQDGATALYEACRNHHTHAVELLLSHGADANRPGKDGLLPLHMAARHGNHGIISKLLPITEASELRRSGISPLHLSAESDEDHALELLIHAGFDVNFLLSRSRSCLYEDRRVSVLYFAVHNRNLEATRMLLEAGADPNLDPFNVLLLAVRQGDVHMATLLLEHGANVNASLPTRPSNFPACLMLSVWNMAMIKCLLDHGCDAGACFQCEYGAEEHPTFNRSQTETLPCLQFCEMFSALSGCVRTGRVIDLLLDYVSQGKLCSKLQKLLERDESWTQIRDKSSMYLLPQSLMHLCRVRIRQLLGINGLKRLRILPGRLIRFLNHDVQGEKDLLWIMAVAQVSGPNLPTSSVDTEDYSIYANMSEEQLLQLAIERSLADTNSQQNWSHPSRLTTQRSALQRFQNIPPPANPPAIPTANPPSDPPCSLSDSDFDPFLSAVWKGDAKALSELIQSNSRNLLEANREGWFPLHKCAYYGHLECLKVLLSACEKGTEEAVGLLLRYGALTTRASVQGTTPLHEAVPRKNLEMCKMLLQARANLNAKNIYGIDPLFTAAECGAAEVLSFLLMKGADINTKADDGASALFEASKNGHSEVVEILLSKGAEVNKSNNAGLLPIHIAAKNGHDGVVAMLIPRTSRAKLKQCGISPLHLAAERNRDNVLEILINAGLDVNFRLSDDWSKMYEDHRSTALYCAVCNSNVEGVTMLLEAGANPNLDFFNPLLVAVRKGCMEMVKLLVSYGANINSILTTHPTKFPAALLFCFNYLPMIKYLMDNGCDALSCFQCDYGSNTHPPIKESRDRRERLYYISEESFERSLQFCEIISRPSASIWAGPIIDILLDYVGHVKLCSRLNDYLNSYSKWAEIREKATPPRPLMHLCRINIRQQLGIKRLRQINKLPLPGRLMKFLRHDRESFADIL
ncbi:ankyrin repeat and SOCS box protein 2-like [Silurus asotus]|uniref:Ankyrin repeat and SOCS box protein 2-like n=1 Tax=Silurus asotus TaxID=30991 RepID=A0AAD5AFJ2_SILAS|nr:ankyrin repeat and SOCS box protein 2-like [Silurus asotus]